MSTAAVDDALLGGRIEIDHDVAAKNGVERALHRPGRDEVELLETEQFAQGRADPDRGRAPAGSTCSSGAQVGRRALDDLARSIPPSRPGPGLGVDVGREDPDVEARGSASTAVHRRRRSNRAPRLSRRPRTRCGSAGCHAGPARSSPAARRSRRWSKWCRSRKNAVWLVVSTLRSCGSSRSGLRAAQQLAVLAPPCAG